MSKKVFIYTIPRKTATGISEWANDSSGVKMNKTKIGRASDSFMALYSPKVGGLANYISYNYYIDPETGVPAKNDEGKDMLLQEYLEIKWNKPKDYFTNRAWMKGDSLKEEDLTYFQKKSWQLNDGATVLDLNKMDDEIGYYMFLASPFVANSEREWKEHKWSRALYYIALENESESAKHRKNFVKLKAQALLVNNDFTNILQRKTLSILGIKPTTDVLTDEQVFNNLHAFIEQSTYLPGSNLDKFNEVTNLLETAPGREQFEARWILQQALDRRIVFEKQGIYTWVRPSGNLVIGDRYAEAVDFFLNPKKEDEIEEIKLAIASK